MKKITSCCFASTTLLFPVAQAASRVSRNQQSDFPDLFHIFCIVCVAFIVLSIVCGIISAVNAGKREQDRIRREEERERRRQEQEAKMSAHRQFVAEQRRLMSDSLRYDVLRRDGFRCQICGATQKDGVKLHVDHIYPVSKGGKTEMSNLRTLCERCNMGKSDKIENIDTDYLDPYDDFDFYEPTKAYDEDIGSFVIGYELGHESPAPTESRSRRKRR